LGLKVGARIRELRQEQRLSLFQLAKKSGVSKGHISSVERGLAVINVGTIDKLAKALGLELFDLVILPDAGPRAALVEKQRLESLCQTASPPLTEPSPTPGPRRRSR
jgi:transcriptional regulator with XRE-family HTH domain